MSKCIQVSKYADRSRSFYVLFVAFLGLLSPNVNAQNIGVAIHWPSDLYFGYYTTSNKVIISNSTVTALDNVHLNATLMPSMQYLGLGTSLLASRVTSLNYDADLDAGLSDVNGSLNELPLGSSIYGDLYLTLPSSSEKTTICAKYEDATRFNLHSHRRYSQPIAYTQRRDTLYLTLQNHGVKSFLCQPT